MKFNEIAQQQSASPAKFTSSMFNNDCFSSKRFAMNLASTNTVKLDSKFNKDFIEDENRDNSILGTSAQGRAIGNDLLNIIDSDTSVSSIKQSPKAEMVQNFQKFNLNDSPNEHSNQSSTNDNSGSASNDQPEFSSLFTQQALYMPQVPTQISIAAINAPAFKPSGNYFKPVSQVKEFVPTAPVM